MATGTPLLWAFFLLGRVLICAPYAPDGDDGRWQPSGFESNQAVTSVEYALAAINLIASLNPVTADL